MMKYNIAMYLRLSSADDETGATKIESDSIVSQRQLLNSYLDESKELASFNRTEFVDDGFSGTSSIRPQFLKMMELVQTKAINLICVKDFSRFFRDYIEAGNYLEYVFPFLGVRFISLNDNYDSDNFKGTTGGVEMAMRNIIYAAYSKDLSSKTVSAKEQMMKQGKFVGSHAPYGYIMHPTIRNKLAPDTESATIVRRIFDEALGGHSTSQIAVSLNNDNILTPGGYFKKKYPDNKKFSFMSGKIRWSAAMVYLILTNQRYTGALVSGRKKKASVSSKKYIRQEPIIVLGMHEPIVTEKEYEQAQAVIKSKKPLANRQAKAFPLKSLVRCGNCNRLMRYKKGANGQSYFTCVYSIRDENTACPIHKQFSEKKIERIALNSISRFMEIAGVKIQKEKSIDTLGEVLEELKNLQIYIEKHKARKLTLYEDYASDAISKETYLIQKAKVDKKIDELYLQIESKQNYLRKITSEKEKEKSELETAIKNFANQDELTHEMALAFISTIHIYDDEHIDINMKFEDVFSQNESPKN